MNERDALALMKRQLADMKRNPKAFADALSSGFVCAGFGGNLNGIDVPETLLTGRLPAGVSVDEAFSQVVRFMEQIIREAERFQGRERIGANVV
ncbi:MAG: hypothetical protein K2N58_08070 [Treponemataceae bacterium]|nr:hypothetical protein [Treponemataceae bacterium]